MRLPEAVQLRLLAVRNPISMFHSRVIVQGAGPTVVFIHGVGLDHTMWDQVARRLSPQFSVLRYDIVGHGQTPPRPGALTFAQLTAQVREVLAESKVDKCSLVGFSLGALIAQGFTLTHPDQVCKLVLLNSAYARSAAQQAGIMSRLRQVEEHGVASNVAASISRWFTQDYQREHPEQIKLVEDRIRRNDRDGFLAAYRLFAQSDSAFQGKLNMIKAPTLVITGEEDVGSTPDMSRAIAAEIEHAECRIFPQVKHMLPVENADKLAAELKRFLNGDNND